MGGQAPIGENPIDVGECRGFDCNGLRRCRGWLGNGARRKRRERENGNSNAARLDHIAPLAEPIAG